MAVTTIDGRDPTPGNDPHGALAPLAPTAGPPPELVTSCRAITPEVDAPAGARCRRVLQVRRAG